ncbi:MAG: peptidylprolyl isomerase [Acidobacteria bacterium]|nr:peptidylprolyl isomerase [Acidobacteriota bacterium]
MYEKESPVTVKNFADLALGRKAYKDPRTGQTVRKPLYPGTGFHRVIPGFMIQGGDPLDNGTGGTEPIIDESDPSLTFDKPGLLAMANAGPGTGSCQFFITEAATPWLNGRHTIFGIVVEGQDVVERIARVPRDGRDKPREPVTIKTVTFNRVGPPPGAAKPARAATKGTTKKGGAPVKKAAPAKPATEKK